MNNNLFLAPKKESVLLRVHLQPLNENQELNYSESFLGTPEQIVHKSREIIGGLSNTLEQGSFTVKIEDFNLTDCIIITNEAILDGDFQPINIFEEALK